MGVFSVTGGATVAFAWCVSVVAIFAVAKWWDALGRPGVSGIAARLAAVGGVGCASALSLVIAANSVFGWFTTWQDAAQAFRPIDPLAVTTTTSAGSTAIPLTTTAAPPASPHGPAAPADFGNATAESWGSSKEFPVRGARSGHAGKVRVWLPPSYARRAPGQTFPMIYAFHGHPGDVGVYTSFLKLQDHIKSAVEARAMRSAIVVIPSWAPNGLDTECTDGAGRDPRMFTWLSQDVTTWVERSFATTPDRAARATWGYSAGAYCALLLALKRTDYFAGAVSFSGYTRPIFDTRTPPFEPRSATANSYDVGRQLATKPALALWLLTAKNDLIAARPTKNLAGAVGAPTSATLVELPRGGHRLDPWMPFQRHAMAWLGTSLGGFAPSGRGAA